MNQQIKVPEKAKKRPENKKIEVPVIETAVLINYKNKKESSEMKIINKEEIGRGDYGIVYRAEIELKNGKRICLALKEFHSKFKEEEIKEHIYKQINMFDALKEEKIPTFDVFRMNKNNPRQIFLSLENLDKECLIISNNYSKDSVYLENNPISVISNEASFINQCKEILKKANSANISLSCDSFFFIYNKKNNKLSIKVCDFDHVRKNPPSSTTPKNRNRQEMESALNIFNNNFDKKSSLRLILPFDNN